MGFDNERGKGDHFHLDGKEYPYQFISVEQLTEDFISAVAARRES
ncbi:peptidylprolyl isomerase [Ectothiorhodosinus mongolicus]|nr:peptidylprolyl isomerase [Ectothiorhodosinus mongolicus]